MTDSSSGMNSSDNGTIILVSPLSIQNIQISMNIKNLPWEDVRGNVEDLIAGLVGLESACYGKEEAEIKYKNYEHGYDINYEWPEKIYSRYCHIR